MNDKLTQFLVTLFKTIQCIIMYQNKRLQCPANADLENPSKVSGYRCEVERNTIKGSIY